MHLHVPIYLKGKSEACGKEGWLMEGFEEVNEELSVCWDCGWFEEVLRCFWSC